MLEPGRQRVKFLKAMKSLVVILAVHLSLISCVSSKHHSPKWRSRDDLGMRLDEQGFLQFMDASRTKAKDFAKKQELLAHMLKDSSYNVGASDVQDGLSILNSCLLDDVDEFLMDMLTALWNGSHIGIDRVSQHLQPCGKLVTYVLDSSLTTLDKREAAKHFANDLKCMAMLSREVFWYSKLDGPLQGADIIEAVVHTLTDVIRMHRAAVELDWAAHVAFTEDHIPGAGINSHKHGHSEDPLGYNSVHDTVNTPTKRKNTGKDDYLKMLVRNLMTSLSRSRSPRSVHRSQSHESQLRSDVLRAIVDNIRNAVARSDSDSTSKESSSELESGSEFSDDSGLNRNSQRSSVDGQSRQRAKKNYLEKLLKRLLSKSSVEESVTTTETTTTATNTATTDVTSTTTMSPEAALQWNIEHIEEILRYLKKVKPYHHYTISAIAKDNVVRNMVSDLYNQLLSTSDGPKIILDLNDPMER